MKIINRIFKSLFIFILFVGSLNIYGYNLVYEGKYVDSERMVEITTMTSAYKDTIKEYEDRAKTSDGWVIATAEDKGTSGSEYTFATPYYIFYKMTDPVPTKYNSGFNESTSNLTKNNIYYDTNNKNRS